MGAISLGLVVFQIIDKMHVLRPEYFINFTFLLITVIVITLKLSSKQTVLCSL